MGMAASQVRFLSLQNRKNTIGRQLSTLSNRKTSLARDMKNVSRHYTDALNQTNLKWSNDCGANYHNLTYDMLMKPNEVNASVPYILTNANNGKVILNNSALYTPDTMFEDVPETLKADEAIVIGGQTIANAGDEISYITLAKMISSFKSIDDKGDPVYDTKGAYTTNVEGNLVGQAGITKGYYIPDTVDFNFKNNLRYKLFEILGLVTDEQVKTQNSMLVELYGSEDAKNTGIYPIGSAYGDYYLALSNLEAYEAYLEKDQKVSNSSLASGSGKTQKDFKESVGDYNYVTNVYNGTGNPSMGGDKGSSTTTQTGGTKGAASHIDFTNVVSKNNDGYSEMTNDAGKMNEVFNNYSNEYLSTSTSSTMDITITNTGVKYTYKKDDLLASGLKAFDTASADDSLQLKEANSNSVAKTLANGGGLRCVDNRRKNNFNESNIKQGLEITMDSFANIIKQNDIVDLTTPEAQSAMGKAKSSTISRLWDERKTESWGFDHTVGGVNSRAQGLANGHGLGGCRKAGGRPAYPKAVTYMYLDMNVAYNMYMTFFNYYYNNPDQAAGSISSTNILNQVESKLDNTDTDNDSSTIKTSNGVKYSEVKSNLLENDTKDATGNIDSSVKVINIERNFLTTDISQAQDTSYIALVETSSDGHVTNYYFSKNSESAGYFVNESGSYTSQQMYINEANGTQTVYGTVQKETTSGTTVYYFTSSSAMSDYVNNGRISSSGVISVALNDNASATSSDLKFKDDSEDKIILTTNKSTSFYDIKVDGKVNDDTTYHEKLKQAVVKAQERISELESNLENFYGDADKKIMDYYDALFLRISEQGWEEDNYTKNDLYLNNKIQNNDFFLTECLQKSSNTGFNYTAKQATNVIKIFTVHDDDAENQALAEYEAKKSEIQYKENVIDTRMAKLETEQESINTEMEGIKKVRDDNIQKNFKIFA